MTTEITEAFDSTYTNEVWYKLEEINEEYYSYQLVHGHSDTDIFVNVDTLDGSCEVVRFVKTPFVYNEPDEYREIVIAKNVGYEEGIEAGVNAFYGKIDSVVEKAVDLATEIDKELQEFLQDDEAIDRLLDDLI